MHMTIGYHLVQAHLADLRHQAQRDALARAARRARLAKLREIGADNFSVYLMHDAQDATLDAYASHVIGAL
jgi:hypothetical protein